MLNIAKLSKEQKCNIWWWCNIGQYVNHLSCRMGLQLFDNIFFSRRHSSCDPHIPPKGPFTEGLFFSPPVI